MRRAPELLAALLVSAGVASADTAYVTCQPGEAVSVIDIAEAKELARWPLAGKPAGVATAPGHGLYTVAPEAKMVRRLDPSSGEFLREISLPGGPTGIALDAARGRVFVSDWFNARLWVLDAASLEVLQELETGASPAGISLSGDGRYLASADKDADQVSIFDAQTLALLHRVPVGTRPYGLRFAPDGRLFVGNVGTNDMSVVDPQSGTLLATVPVGDRPYGVAFAKGYAFVTNQYANTVSVIALDGLRPVATLDVGEYPEGIDTTPDGARVVLVNWFDNTVMVIDPATHAVVDTIDTCDGPRAFGVFLTDGGLR